MELIRARNVNDAYVKGVALLRSIGEPQKSRAGDVIVAPCPVTTVYERPLERVLFDTGRDANPFFHFFEALWMLAGRHDARWLDLFVKDFSSRFAEPDGYQHGAYGMRWRNHWFACFGYGVSSVVPGDQLDTIVRLLKANPNDRRVVLTMWDPAVDLAANKRDIPCNTQAYLRVRTDIQSENPPATFPVLDLTVCCRSNDIIWGAYGANAVHFSVLQEYLAARIGVSVGTYTQISNNFHAYTGMLDKVGTTPGNKRWYEKDVVRYGKMVESPDMFDGDLSRFMAWTDDYEYGVSVPQDYSANPWFHHTAEPLFVAAERWRAKDRIHVVELVGNNAEIASDWRRAVTQWVSRRMI